MQGKGLSSCLRSACRSLCLCPLPHCFTLELGFDARCLGALTYSKFRFMQVDYATYSEAPWVLPMGGLLSIHSGCADLSLDTVQVIRISILEVSLLSLCDGIRFVAHILQRDPWRRRRGVLECVDTMQFDTVDASSSCRHKAKGIAACCRVADSDRGELVCV